MRELRKTVFIDIDGCILRHNDSASLYDMITQKSYNGLALLPNVIDRFIEWRNKDYYIVITTARPEGCRRVTEEQLVWFGLFWDQMVMGLPVGPRVVINDQKPNGLITAEAICLTRNEGLTRVEI